MTVPILTTKLFIPTIPNKAVLRPRLLDKLNQGQQKNLTLVSAPAGFGKSTLVASWLAGQAKPAAWVSLDEYDNDPIRFFSYIIAALCNINLLQKNKCQDIIQAANLASLENVNVLLTNQLAQLTEPAYLILDDYHLIKKDEIHQLLSMLIESQLPHFHIILISRTEPPLAIARMRARNQLVEIHAEDLRFNPYESADYLNQVMNLGLSQDDILKLEQQTEGWITGLQLAALSLQSTEGPTQLVDQITGDHWYIADYLIGEVLSKQPETIQDFLVKTSILERMSADLCNAVLEISDSQTKLEQLEKSNLFLIPLDSRREWYRYHHLFADMLQSRLGTLPGETVQILYWRAFEWHKENRLLEAAVKYGIQGKFYDQAADIIETVGGDIYWHNRANTLHEWFRQLPESLMASRPHLQILSAYNTIDLGNIQDTEKAILEIRNNLKKLETVSTKQDRILEGKLAAIEMAVAYHRYQDSQRCIQLAKTALALLPESYQYDRTVAAFHGGGGHLWAGDLDQAEEYLQLALLLSNQLSNPLANLLTRSNCGYLELTRGQLEIARQHFLQAYQIAGKIKVRQSSTFSKAVVGLANLHYEWNQIEDASRLAEEGIQKVETGEFLDQILIAYEIAIQVESTKQNYDRAHEYLQKLDQLAIHYNAPPGFFKEIERITAQLSLQEENNPQAERWANIFAATSQMPINYENEKALLVFARVKITQAQYTEAIDILRKSLEPAELQGRNNSIIAIEVLLAKANHLKSNTTEAHAHLTRALKLGQLENYTRTFLDEGPAIQTLLETMAKAAPQSEFPQSYVKNLLAQFSLEAELNQQATDTLTGLTEREMDVLHSLSQGYSYSTIGEQLSISKNTVRSHIKSIYSKLGVSNRTQALIEAQKANLLNTD